MSHHTRTVALVTTLVMLLSAALALGAEERKERERPRPKSYTEKIEDDINSLREQIRKIDDAIVEAGGEVTREADRKEGDKKEGDKKEVEKKDEPSSKEKESFDEATAEATRTRNDMTAARAKVDEAQKQYAQARIALNKEINGSAEIQKAEEELNAAKAAYDAVHEPILAALAKNPDFIEAAQKVSRARAVIRRGEAGGNVGADALDAARKDLSDADELINKLEESAAAKTPNYAQLKTAYEQADEKYNTLVENLETQKAVTEAKASVDSAQDEYSAASKRASEASQKQLTARSAYFRASASTRAAEAKIQRLELAKVGYEKQIKALEEKMEKYKRSQQYIRR